MDTILRVKKLEYVRFIVRFIDQIMPDSQTGKKRLIISNEWMANPLNTIE